MDSVNQVIFIPPGYQCKSGAIWDVVVSKGVDALPPVDGLRSYVFILQREVATPPISPFCLQRNKAKHTVLSAYQVCQDTVSISVSVWQLMQALC